MTDFSQIENSIIQVKKRDGRVSDFQRDKISNRPKEFTLYHRAILKIAYELHSISGEYIPNLSEWAKIQKSALSDLIQIGLVELKNTKHGTSVCINSERIEEIRNVLDGEINATLDDYTFSTIRLGQGISITTNTHLMTKVGQTIPIMTLVENNQARNQSFACLVQIQNETGVTQTLSNTSGSLSSGASMSISQSWTPTIAGTYNAQIFAWENIDNPRALTTPITVTISVE